MCISPRRMWVATSVGCFARTVRRVQSATERAERGNKNAGVSVFRKWWRKGSLGGVVRSREGYKGNKERPAACADYSYCTHHFRTSGDRNHP
ncbi:unnamed protein product [Ectocarpus sp. 6 AP-2014]